MTLLIFIQFCSKNVINYICWAGIILIKSCFVFSGNEHSWNLITFLYFVDFSVLGHFHATFMKDITVYGATKFSVTAITESLRELMCVQNLPIRVTVICF